MRNEAGPAVDSVRGGDEASKKKIEAELARRHADQSVAYEDVKFLQNDPQKHEREKSPEELQIIAMANEVTDGLRATYGLDPQEIPAENIHYLERNKYIDFNNAFYVPLKQSIEVGALGSPKMFSKSTRTHIIVHEMIHMKSYNAFKPKGDDDMAVSRVGLNILSEDGPRLFTMLNEAITDELAQRCLRKLEETDPVLKQEAEERGKLAVAHSEEIEEGVLHLREKDGLFGKKLVQEKGGYGEEVRALNILVDKLHAQFSDDFKDRDEVFDLFGKAAMTGKMLVLSRIITKAFGEGAFRKIAEAKSEGKGSLLKVVESL